MKKILSLIVLLAGVISFTSCGDDDATYTAIQKLEVSQAEVLFEAEGGTGSVTINTSSAVTATTESSWLTVAANGNRVTVTAPLNVSLNGRSAAIIIKSGDAQAIVTATQKGSVYGIAGGLEYQLPDVNGKVSVPVVHTTDVIVNSLSDWLTATFNSATSTIDIVAASNDAETAREGYVAFATGDNIKDTLVITQDALLFEVEKASLDMPVEGDTMTVAIKHSRPVSAEVDAEWLECKLDAKGNVLTVIAAENTGEARQGTVTVKSLAAVRTITVNQAAAATEEPEEPVVENPYYGTYTFYFVYGEDTYNMGNFSIVEYVGEDAEEGDVLIIDLYLPGSAIFGVLKPEEGKLYIAPYQDLGYDEYTGLGTIGNLTYSASGADWIVFDITEQGIVSSDFCVLATNPEYTEAYGLVLPSGGTSWFIKAEEAAARSMQRAAAAKKNTFKLQRNLNLPKDFKVFRK